MRWLVTCVVLVVLAGCPGSSSSGGGGGGGGVGGGGGGTGTGGGGGGSTVCAPAGVWMVDYDHFMGQTGCQPPEEQLVVVALDDGGFNASFGLHTYNACGGAVYHVPSNRSVSFDAGSCELSVVETSSSCWSGESQGNDRDLVLKFAGDNLTGSGTGDACPTVGTGPAALTATGHRLPSPYTGAGGGDACTPPTLGGDCNPVGTWKVDYHSGGPFVGCAPDDDVVTISVDGGAIEASLVLDAGTACAPGVFFQPIHQDSHFDEARCELTLTTGVTWCDGPDGGNVHQDQRSVLITFAGDAGAGTGTALSVSCNAQEISLCVRASRGP